MVATPRPRIERAVRTPRVRRVAAWMKPFDLLVIYPLYRKCEKYRR